MKSEIESVFKETFDNSGIKTYYEYDQIDLINESEEVAFINIKSKKFVCQTISTSGVNYNEYEYILNATIYSALKEDYDTFLFFVESASKKLEIRENPVPDYTTLSNIVYDIYNQRYKAQMLIKIRFLEKVSV